MPTHGQSCVAECTIKRIGIRIMVPNKLEDLGCPQKASLSPLCELGKVSWVCCSCAASLLIRHIIICPPLVVFCLRGDTCMSILGRHSGRRAGLRALPGRRHFVRPGPGTSRRLTIDHNQQQQLQWIYTPFDCNFTSQPNGRPAEWWNGQDDFFHTLTWVRVQTPGSFFLAKIHNLNFYFSLNGT